MKYKVVYILIILLFAILNSGYSQKVSLILLPSGSTEIQTYDIQTEEIVPDEHKGGISYSEETIQLTPNKSERRRSHEMKKQRLCKIIGSFCLKKWSKGLIKLYSLPSAPGITL